MSKITIDAALAQHLAELHQSVELCDPSGIVVGRFTPVDPSLELCDESGKVLGKFVPKSAWAGWEPVDPEPTREELDEIEKTDKWYTTAEVLQHLKKLEEK